jgi:hypothetical protein
VVEASGGSCDRAWTWSLVLSLASALVLVTRWEEKRTAELVANWLVIPKDG